MNIINRMNDVMEYVEIHLKEEINIEEVSKILGCSYSEFQRVFSLLNEISFYEYIRCRRLSQAAVELIHTNRKILDIALEYGYESGDSFAAAFRHQYGLSPSLARKEERVLNLFHPRSFDFSIHGNEKMEYKILHKPKMKMSGISIHSSQSQNCAPQFWVTMKKDGTLEDMLNKASTNISYGLCFGYDHEGNNRYMIAVEKELTHPYKTHELPDASWMVFEGIGPLSTTLHHMWKRIYTEVLPASLYDKNNDIPTIEKYYGNDCENEDYKIEIWIPIIRTNIRN